MRKLLSGYVEEFGWLDLLIIALLLIFVTSAARAQPQHVGALVNMQFEGSGSGNGTIVGVELQDVDYLRIKGQDFKLASNVSFTIDKKVYRNQFGGSVRASSLLRYAPANQHLLFLQGGVQVGGIAFPNTPGSSDGYAKYIARPVVGAGVDLTHKEWSAVFDYQLHFKRRLQAQPIGFNNIKKRVTDGWTSGHRFGVATTINLSPNWLLLLNGAAGWYTYQRNAEQYGPVLGAVVHRFNAYEFSAGIGRRYGKQN